METYPLVMGDEEVQLYWKNGAVCAEGYDLKDERIALALNGGYGEGMSVMLLAINEWCTEEEDIEGICSECEVGFRVWRESDTERSGVVSSIAEKYPNFANYLSYSPTIDVRTAAVIYLTLFDVNFSRLCKDRELAVRKTLATRDDLSLENFYALSKDEEDEVRFNVASHESCPPEILKNLVNDSAGQVMMAALIHKFLPVELALEIVSNGTMAQKLVLATFGRHKEALELLAKDPNEDWSKSLANNQYYRDLLDSERSLQ